MRRERYKFSWNDHKSRAICDRCGFTVAHRDLREQLEFRGGDAPVGTGILVCGSCYDEPQPFFARPLIGRDPTPVKNPRPVPPAILLPE